MCKRVAQQSKGKRPYFKGVYSLKKALKIPILSGKKSSQITLF